MKKVLQQKYLDNIFTSNPEKINNKKFEKCLQVYILVKSKSDLLPSNLKKKVKNQLALEKKRKKEKFARDRLSRQQYEESKLSQFTHKGITYVASKRCTDGKQFYWNINKGFLKKDTVYEIGCLSDYEFQSLKRQQRGGSVGSGLGTNMMQQQQIHNNR